MTRRSMVIALAGALTLVACGGGAETGGAGGAPGEQGIDVGSVQAVDLPKEFPTDLPLPDDAKAVFVSDTEDGQGVWFASASTADELDTFFQGALNQSEEWTLTWHTRVDEASGTYSVYSVKSERWTGTLYVGNGGPGAEAYAQPYSFRVILTKA